MVAILTGYLFNLLLFKGAEIKSWVIAYVTLILSALSGMFSIVVIAILFVIKQTKVKNISHGVVFIALLPMLPSALGIVLSGFGVNYFFTLYYPQLLVLCVLTYPLIKSNFKRLNLTDKLVFIYVILLCILTYRAENFTSSIREVLIIMTSIFIPYFSFSVALKNKINFDNIAITFVVISVFLSAISVYEYFLHWTYFKYLFSREMFEVPAHYFAHYSRGESVRAVSSIGNPIPLAYYLLISLLFGYYLYSVNKIKKKSLYIYTILIISSIYFTGSRAGLLSVFLLPVIYMRFSLVGISKKILFDAGVVITVMLVIFNMPNLNAIDEHGTFQYRVELIENSLKLIFDNWSFGSRDYISNLEEMRQGQGIIDIVNTYLSVALQTGLSGLILFIMVFISAIRSLSKVIVNSKNERSPNTQVQAKYLILACTITMFFIATVSSVSVIPYMYWAILGLVSVFVKSKKQIKSTHILNIQSTNEFR